ncbi:MAG TPA: diguanylate cyclase [Acidovorax sp.]|nr:diguanylate cyclase [Acidovorax sp.]
MDDPLRLLLLEDSADDADLNLLALRKAGLVFTALRVDSQDAFTAALDAFKPDIILADYRLPGFDGLQALAIARDKAPATPYIFVSGVIGEEFAVDGIKRGATDYVLKDRLARLPVAVQHALEEVKLRAQRSEARERLRESENRYRLLVENSPMCIHEIDMAGRITSMNRAGLRMMGVEDEDAVRGFPYLDAVCPADRAHIEALLANAYAGETRQLEFMSSAPGGPVFKSYVAPIKNENGDVIRLMGMTEDITERKAAEAELRIAATAFESQEGMMITDAWSVILRVNRAFTDITGFTAEEAVGRKASLLKSGRHDAAFYAAMWESVHRDGSWQGEIWNRRKNGEVYPEWLTITAVNGAGGEVTHYVATLTDITRRKAAEDEIKHLAFYDPLTRLPNRRLLLDRLQQALASSTRSRREGALLFIDLDNFKTLNDTLGHDIGDLLLQQVAQRLATCVREGDTVARLGGDEFVVMLEELSPKSHELALHARGVGEKILAMLAVPYALAGYQYRSTPSIGIAPFTGELTSVGELLKQADLAMYQAKTAGRNTLRFFDPDMQAVVTARAGLETDLRAALAQEEFLLHFQPQMHQSGRCVGVEALVRWAHPQRGMVPPAVFIPLAEETGLILPLGRWVLHTACKLLATWQADPQLAHLTMAVNVSSRQFRHASFVDDVARVLAITGAPAHLLKLELTESLLVEDMETTIATMAALRSHGVGFSLDDFGTGYSSLSYLKRMPLDQLKIDQSFVRDLLTDPNDAAIVDTIIGLSRSLGLEVIAEGVETPEQRELLARAGCQLYQGYLFSRPLSADLLGAFLRPAAA